MKTSKPFKKNPLTVAIQAVSYSMLGALPLAQATTGGQVVGGNGTINQSGTNTTINQASQNLAINWQTFNIAANERVQFIQPNASAIALNRILSNNGSTIAGRIDANGKVILVNPNGIFFTPTSVLNVGSLIASGLTINPADFMNGNYIFNEMPGTNGTVINSGTINASLGGNVALLGKRVENNGLIVANLGTVTLAAGKQAVLTFDTGGLLGVRVSQEILQSELGVDPAVLNSGTINAQGGRVLLTASVSKDIFSQAVNTTGLQQATSVVVNADGTFSLGGGADVVNTGSIDTSTTAPDQNSGRIVLIGDNVTSSGVLRADAANGNGGEIELHASNMTLLTQNSVTSARAENNGIGGVVKVLGDKVGLFDQATVDVSGANGGGQALIGGDFQGKNTNIRNANATIVKRDAKIYADALENGDGGKVIVWSDDYTYFLGNASTRGGSLSGNGGLVETSGKNYLYFDGVADRTAANGRNGLLLLDPKFINISSSGTSSFLPNVDFDEGTGASASARSESTVTLSVTALADQLVLGNVTLQANTDIRFNVGVSSTDTTGGNGLLTNDLILQAGKSIFIGNNTGSSAVITLNGGSFSATINDRAADDTYRDAGTATFTMNSGSSITTNGGSIFINTRDEEGSIGVNGNLILGRLNSSGIDATVSNTAGGNAGTITLKSGDLSTNFINLNADITANGGAGMGTGAQGNARAIIIDSPIVNVNGARQITATSSNGVTNQGDITISFLDGTSEFANDMNIAGSLTVSAGAQADARVLSIIDYNGSGTTGFLSVSAGNNVDLLGSIADSTPSASDRLAITLTANSDGGTAGDVTILGLSGSDTVINTGGGVFSASGVNYDARSVGNKLSISTGVGNAVINMTGFVQLGEMTVGGNLNVTAGAAESVSGASVSQGRLLAGNFDKLTVTGTSTFNSTGTGDIALTNNNDLQGAIALTATGGANHQLTNTATTTILGAINVAGSLAVNATANLRVTNAPVTSAGNLTLTFGTQGTGSYSFCYLSGAACADATTTASTTLTSTTGNLSVVGGAGVDTFNLAGMTLSAPAGSVSLSGAANADTVIGQNIQTAWDVTASNVGALVNAQGTVNFTGMENLTGGSGNDTFTVNPVALASPVTLTSINTGNGTNFVTVNANGSVTGAVTTGSGTNTVTVNGTVGSILGNTGNGANTINVDTGGAVSGAITLGSGIDVFNITGTGTVSGLMDGGAGADTLNVLTAGRTVKLGTAGVTSGVLYVDRVETINATGTGNFLLGHDNNAVQTTWNINTSNQGTVNYTSNSATPVTFNAFDNLTGGTGADTFTMGAAGSISGILNGGAGPGTNTLVARQGVANVWSFDTTTSGSLAQAGSPAPVTYVTSFTNIQNFTGAAGLDWADFSQSTATVNANAGSYTDFVGIIGNGTNSTLTGGNGQTNNWSVQAVVDQNNVTTDGLNDGVVTVGVSPQLRFVNFGTLTGGDSFDNFVIDASGSMNGTINGGSGANTLTAKNIANTWSINSTPSTLTYGGLNTAQPIAATTTFSAIQTLTGGSEVDTITVAGSVGTAINNTVINTGGGVTNSVTVNAGVTLTGTINGGTGADTITVNGAVTGSLNAGAGIDVIVLGAAGNVTGVIDGGADADTLDITARTAATTVQIGNTPIVNNLVVYQVETINANGAVANTLIGDAGNNTWLVNTPNNGSVAGITFTGFQNLTGGDGIDMFTVNSSIGNIDTGNGVTNSVTVNATGVVTGTITGGAGADTVTLVSGSSVTTINGGAGNDIFNISGTVGTINGGNGDDVFNININGSVTGALNGDAGDDLFTVNAGGVVKAIDGGTNNPISASTQGDTLTLPANADISIGAGLGVGITNIEGVVSTNGTLRARDGFNTIWDISGADRGIVADSGNQSLSFVGFSNLFGSTGNDTFNITGNGSLTGQIAAGNGSNSLNVTLDLARLGGQVYYIGGTGTDTVTMTGTSNTVVYSSALNFNGNTYDRLAYTGTNAVPNTFAVNYTSASVETVTDQVAANTLVINGTSTSDVITLGNASFTVNGQRTVSFTNNNKSNLVVDAAPSNSGQGSNADTIAITGNFSTAANNVTLRNTNTLNQAAGTIAATELALDRITNLPAQLNTAIASLSVTNSGPVSISQTGNLALNQISATGAFTVVASGNITDTATAQRNISGPLSLTSTGGNILLDKANFNFLSGPITLTGATVNINNSALTGTNFASVNTTALTVISAGNITQNITQTGAIIAPIANLTAAGSNITLNHAANDFNNLTITADAVSVTDLSATGGPSIASGLITANSVELTTANGIGSATESGTGINNNQTVFIPNNSFATSTSILKVNNSAGGVYVTNNRAATVSITNSGNIGIVNTGNLVVDRLYTNGGNYTNAPGSKVYINVGNGSSILTYAGSPAYPGFTAMSAISEPNIVAAELYMQAGLGAGQPGRADLPGGPLSISVSDSLIYFFGAPSYLHYFVQPPFIFGVGDLVASTALDFLPNLRLLEVESLDEFDPAIFTEIRNYYYEDVAILMPSDQRLDGPDEEEKEKEIEGKL